MFIGFEKTPEGLEAFLEERGYKKENFQEGNSSIENYVNKKYGSPNITFYPQSLSGDEDEIPDWTKYKHEILSELYIEAEHYPLEVIDEAERLSKEIINRFDGVLYDAELDEFFERGQL